MRLWARFLSASLLGGLAAASMSAGQQHTTEPLGLFRGFSDIGATRPGSTSFDPRTKTYRMSGGGTDIWGKADEFSFTWVRVSGDGSLMADVTFAQPLAYPISKAVLMIRQGLSAEAAYADVAIHADGHITLQYRDSAAEETKDTTLPEHGPTGIRLVRKGNTFTASAVFADGHLGAPASTTVAMQDPVYVGIGVGSHNAHALQTVTFSHVSMQGFQKQN